MKAIALLTAVLLASLSRPVHAAGRSPARSAPTNAERSGYPAIALRGEHQIWKTENPVATYCLNASSGALLSVKDLRLIHNGEVVTPNAVSISFSLPETEQNRRYIDDPHCYQLSKPLATNVYVLDRASLEPVTGSQYSEFRAGFPGFHDGDRILLCIGRLAEDASGRQSFSVLWIAKLLVGSPNEALRATAAARSN